MSSPRPIELASVEADKNSMNANGKSSGPSTSDYVESDMESNDWSDEDLLLDNDSDDEDIPSPLSTHPSVPLPTCLHWVRMSSLRCHDNPALTAAMINKNTRFRAVFTYDPWFESGQMFGLNRWRFLIDCLQDLDRSLRSYGTRLYVARGQPLVMIEKLCSRWNVNSITYQVDKDADSHFLEQSVDILAKRLGLMVAKFEGHTLYETRTLQTHSSSILTMKEFRDMLSIVGPPKRPIDAPTLPDAIEEYEQDDTVSQEFRIPTLQDVGFSEEVPHANPLWIGGESEALRKLPEYIELRSKEGSELTLQSLLDKKALSPYIRFGCLSIRQLFWKLKDLTVNDPDLQEFWKRSVSKLLNREFYFTVATQVPNFDCYKNKLCLQLPWHKDADLFQIWREGKTGYPWIDAALRQLWKEGWIHNVMRESIATFLTRGELWINWERGKKVFEELLLDYESSVSSGCWMKSSGSAFITAPMEYYCPVSFGKKIDPSGEYIRIYIPELRHFPAEHIYCPWMAPVDVQLKANCRIGINYPLPIVDHVTTGVLCNARLQSLMSLIHQINKDKPV